MGHRRVNCKGSSSMSTSGSSGTAQSPKETMSGSETDQRPRSSVPLWKSSALSQCRFNFKTPTEDDIAVVNDLFKDVQKSDLERPEGSNTVKRSLGSYETQDVLPDDSEENIIETSETEVDPDKIKPDSDPGDAVPFQVDSRETKGDLTKEAEVELPKNHPDVDENSRIKELTNEYTDDNKNECQTEEATRSILSCCEVEDVLKLQPNEYCLNVVREGMLIRSSKCPADHRAVDNEVQYELPKMKPAIPMTMNELLDERSGVAGLSPTLLLFDQMSQSAVKFTASSRIGIQGRSLSTVCQPTRTVQPDTWGLTLQMFLVKSGDTESHIHILMSSFPNWWNVDNWRDYHNLLLYKNQLSLVVGDVHLVDYRRWKPALTITYGPQESTVKKTGFWRRLKRRRGRLIKVHSCRWGFFGVLLCLTLTGGLTTSPNYKRLPVRDFPN